MALPVNGSTHLISALLLIYPHRKDERLSWPSWLTCSGWFTHISGHPSAAGRRAQVRESSPVRDRRSTTVLRHRLGISSGPDVGVLYRPINPTTGSIRNSPTKHAVAYSLLLYGRLCSQSTTSSVMSIAWNADVPIRPIGLSDNGICFA